MNLRLSLLGAATMALVISGCGHHQDAGHGAKAGHGSHGGHAGHGKKAGHGDHAGHGGHAASQPSGHGGHGGHGEGHSLKPLMGRMLVHMVALQDALATKDVEQATLHATELAEACKGGEEHAHQDLPAAWGPDFVSIDRALHTGAEEMQNVLQSGDLAKASGMYAGLAAQCVGCHSQAPVASKVRLGRIVLAP